MMTRAVDEEIELPRVTEEAARVGLQLVNFQAYDVFRGSPEHQVMVFTTERVPGGLAVLRSRRLDRRLRLVASPTGRRVGRLVHATRLLAHGNLREALWLFTGEAPHVRS